MAGCQLLGSAELQDSWGRGHIQKVAFKTQDPIAAATTSDSFALFLDNLRLQRESEPYLPHGSQTAEQAQAIQKDPLCAFRSL